MTNEIENKSRELSEFILVFFVKLTIGSKDELCETFISMISNAKVSIFKFTPTFLRTIHSPYEPVPLQKV